MTYHPTQAEKSDARIDSWGVYNAGGVLLAIASTREEANDKAGEIEGDNDIETTVRQSETPLTEDMIGN